MTENNGPYANNMLQNFYISNLIKNEIYVRIYLISGVRLTGTIINYDKFSLFLINKDKQIYPQLIYKHSITSIEIDDKAIENKDKQIDLSNIYNVA